MKAFYYFLFIFALVLLVIAYFISTKGLFELSALVNFMAFVCGIVGSRIGGRMHKKNQENK